MGALRFQINPQELVTSFPDLRRAYITGMDRMPWRTFVDLLNGQLVCQRNVPESGSINIPWKVPGVGPVMLRSATLMEREQPYELGVELARGKVNQLRGFAADLDLLGWDISDEVKLQLREVQKKFSRAVLAQGDPSQAASLSGETLRAAIEAAHGLIKETVDRVIDLRREREEPGVVGCRISPDQLGVIKSSALAGLCKTVTVEFCWKRVEPVEGQYQWDELDELVDYCEANGIGLRGGPIIEWSKRALPDWLWLWEKDTNNILSFMCDFVETVMTRYQDRIRSWDITSRTNCSELLSLSEEDRLRLTVRALRIARETDPSATLSVTLGQPWGEYTARKEYQYSPLHFADALIRADLGLGALGIEIVMGYENGASYVRDMLEASMLLDYYSLLGVPLHTTIAAPSSSGNDPLACSSWEVSESGWMGPWNDQCHADWLDGIIRLMLSKPQVALVSLCHLTDGMPHDFAHAGIIAADGSPKAALGRVEQIIKAITIEPSS